MQGRGLIRPHDGFINSTHNGDSMYGETAPSDIDWSSKTYTEIRDVGDRDGSIAIVPVGSIEQHGHHLPVATDSILATAAARTGAELASEEVPVLVTPTEWVGSSPHHLSFGGTISGEFGTLLDLLTQIVDCVADNGFDVVLLVNGHGGNRSLVDSVPRVLGPERPEVDIRACTYFDLPDEERIAEIRESEHGGMAHAGEFETSLLLHLDPDLVDESALDGNPRDADMFGEDDPVSGYVDFETISDSGVAGEPEYATAAAGAKFLDEIGRQLDELLRELHRSAQTR